VRGSDSERAVSHIAEAQEHHAQVGLDRDGGTAEVGAEERDERLEEGRVVEQAVDARKSKVGAL
jgi:hypothetical protein